jgi:hypothetical protein
MQLNYPTIVFDDDSKLQRLPRWVSQWKEMHAGGFKIQVGFDLEWHIPERDWQKGVVASTTVPCWVQLAFFCAPGLAVELLKHSDFTETSKCDAETDVVCILIDCITLPPIEVGTALMELFADTSIEKLGWDVREDSHLLKTRFGIQVFNSILDVQLLRAVSAPRGRFPVPNVSGLKKALENDLPPAVRAPILAGKASLDLRTQGSECFLRRDGELREDVRQYMVADVVALRALHDQFQGDLRIRFPNKVDERLADARDGSLVYTKYVATVPWMARRHGLLPVGILQTVHPTPKNPALCTTCQRYVSKEQHLPCSTCARAAEYRR